MPIIDMKNGRLWIQDGTGTPFTVEVVIGEGNISYSEQFNVDYILNRGSLSGAEVRLGDETPCEVSFDGNWTFLRSDGSETISPYEALTRKHAASSWVSTGADSCHPYSVDLVVEHIPSCAGSGSPPLNERITFSEFRVETIGKDMRAGQLSFAGKCLEVSPTLLRTTSALSAVTGAP